MNFNSIKVRLKLVSIKYMDNSVLDFNSIKVRLKPIISGQDNSGTTFQFHKGTIKTPMVMLSISFSIRFQFHKGTIKTKKGMLHSDDNYISIP